LIQQIWQRPPFKTLLDLSDVESNARIFHQSKDCSLINLIRRKRQSTQEQLKVLTDDERTILQSMQRDTIDLRNMLKEVLDIREGTGRNPRIAIRRLDEWIVNNRNLI